jgi:large subunit ribosomal protein L28
MGGNSTTTGTVSKICQLSGKGPVSGNSVSHSNHKTKRRFLPNLQRKRFYIPELDSWVTLRVSCSALKSIDRLGIYGYMKKLEKKGRLEINF